MQGTSARAPIRACWVCTGLTRFRFRVRAKGERQRDLKSIERNTLKQLHRLSGDAAADGPNIAKRLLRLPHYLRQDPPHDRTPFAPAQQLKKSRSDLL